MNKIPEEKYTIIKETFYKNYYQHIAPIINKFEKERSIKLCTLIISNIISGFLAYVSWKYCKNMTVYPDIDLGWLLATIFVIFIPVSVYYVNMKFRNALKKASMNSLVNVLNIKWQNTNISDDDIIDSGLFGEYDKRINDDVFSGNYKDVPFLISETKLLSEIKGKRFYFIWPVFWGLIIELPSNKTIESRTIVASKWDFNILNKNIFIILTPLLIISELVSQYTSLPPDSQIMMATILGPTLLIIIILLILRNYKTKGEKIKNIKLEDPYFRKKFNVFSKDEIASRYLLTSAFMNRMINMQTVFGTKKVKCSFFEDKIMFSITTFKNLFELGNLFTPLKKPDTILKQLLAIHDLIDYFKLDTKIGL